MKNKKEIIQIVFSSAVIISLLAIAYILVVKEPKVNMVEMNDLKLSSEIASTDPMVTASNFIFANGTMGNVETDITQDKIKTNEAIFENEGRRLIALSKVKDALIPGSPLISGDEESHAKVFTRELNYPYIYKVDNVKVSEPGEVSMLKVFSEVGPSEYDSVELIVSFDSTRIHYLRAGDSSYDGTHTEISNVESFSDLKVTLAKSGDLWFVYDIEDAEVIVNERFATWSGVGSPTTDYSKDEETGEIKIEISDHSEEGQNE